jgi:hypothetical protein
MFEPRMIVVGGVFVGFVAIALGSGMLGGGGGMEVNTWPIALVSAMYGVLGGMKENT